MPINLRSNATNIPDGSITNAKLADDSISAIKLQSNSVTNAKISANAVTTPKLADDAVTTDKVESSIANYHYFGTETEVMKIGNVDEIIAEFNFNKASTASENWKSVSWSGKIKNTTSDSNDITIALYIDGVAHGTIPTFGAGTIDEYQPFASGPHDISALTSDIHKVEIHVNNTESGETSVLGQLDVYFGKK